MADKTHDPRRVSNVPPAVDRDAHQLGGSAQEPGLLQPGRRCRCLRRRRQRRLARRSARPPAGSLVVNHETRRGARKGVSAPALPLIEHQSLNLSSPDRTVVCPQKVYGPCPGSPNGA